MILFYYKYGKVFKVKVKVVLELSVIGPKEEAVVLAVSTVVHIVTDPLYPLPRFVNESLFEVQSECINVRSGW